MGLIGQLNLLVICIDFLAWPVIALGYPLFASIKAVETGSKYHMRKLVIYWTIFALLSLFEFAFVKIIEWIPFWSSIRLVAIFWLVMPQFDGACLAYDSLVRHVLLVNRQALLDKLFRRKEEKLRKRATFLDVAEQYIKENGCEALEKLIASKATQHECKDCNNFPGDIQVLEAVEKNSVQTLKLMKEPVAALHHHGTLKAPNSAPTEAKWHEFKECDNSEREIQVVELVVKNAAATSKQHDSGTLEATRTSAANEVKRVHYAQPKPTAWVPNGTEAAAAKVKEAISPKATVENKWPETPPIKRVQLKESDVSQHDRKTLEATKKSAAIEAKWAQAVQYAESKTTTWVPKGTEAGTSKVNDTPSHEAIAEEHRRLETPPIKNVQQEWTFGLFQVKTTNEKMLNAHLQESKHNFKCVSPKASKLDSEGDIQPVLPEDKIAASTLKQVHSVQSKTAASAWVPKGSETAAAKAREAAPLEESAQNKQIEWTCDLCRMTTASEKTLNAHLQGRTHKSNCESLKASKLNAKDTGLSPKGSGKSNHINLKNEAGQTSSVKTQETNQFQTKPKQEGAANQIFKKYCFLCDVKLVSDIDLAAHLRGRRHLSNIKTMPNLKSVFSLN